jgi:hypothetical protein
MKENRGDQTLCRSTQLTVLDLLHERQTSVLGSPSFWSTHCSSKACWSRRIALIHMPPVILASQLPYLFGCGLSKK